MSSGTPFPLTSANGLLTAISRSTSSCRTALDMNTVLVCVLLCACAVAALPGLHHRELRSPDTMERGKDGGWVLKTDKTRNGGTVVRGEANKKWDVSDDGKIQAEVHGHWERTYGGPGQRDHGVGGSVGGSWGK